MPAEVAVARWSEDLNALVAALGAAEIPHTLIDSTLLDGSKTRAVLAGGHGEPSLQMRAGSAP